MIRALLEKGALAAALSPQIATVYSDLEQQLGPDFVRQLYDSLDRLLVRLDGA